METLLLEWPNWPVVLQILETFLSTPFSAYSLSHLHIPFLIFIFPSSSSYSLSHLHIPFLICIFPFSSANSLSYLHIPFLRLNCKICTVTSWSEQSLEIVTVTRTIHATQFTATQVIQHNSRNSMQLMLVVLNTQLVQFNASHTRRENFRFYLLTYNKCTIYRDFEYLNTISMFKRTRILNEETLYQGTKEPRYGLSQVSKSSEESFNCKG